MERNLEEGKAVRGASTITQQLAKNLFLSTSKDPFLNVIEWCDFGKPASMLERWEAAHLAAVVPSPLKHNPTEETRWINFIESLSRWSNGAIQNEFVRC
ncbi:MAG: transglycosylase domain-containing protein [Bacteroidota bacterium]|nr:transglycosylase domain-containing protein [Bacteroidota bacterium]